MSCSAGACVALAVTCGTGTDPGTAAPWVICSVDATTAWVSANSTGQFHPILICKALGFNTVSRYGGTCGNVCGYCEGATSCSSNGTKQLATAWTGVGNCGSDGLGPLICNTVSWECVY